MYIYIYISWFFEIPIVASNLYLRSQKKERWCQFPKISAADTQNEFSTCAQQRQVGGSYNEGTPIAGWFIMENPKQKWMKTKGTPMA